ncbi:MAG: hypothetical protein FWC94_03370 [Bacteroidales bacterium]|nr:hypothetical protein [Bacteroidales bacterium]
MGNFFKQPELRQFSMKPRYYSEEKERMEELKRRVGDDAADEEERTERIRESFERRRTRKANPRNKVLSPTRVFVFAILIILFIMIVTGTRLVF